MAQHLVVVPHTHWDREWYRTHEEFRLRLVRMLDGLLDLLEADPGFSQFTLDGQTIVLDDYLAVPPEDPLGFRVGSYAFRITPNAEPT